jgi:hypothetical protein
MVIRLVLPEALPGPPQHAVGFSSDAPLPIPENLTQRVVWRRPQNQMHMVGHYYPFIENVLLFVKMKQSLHSYLRYFRTSQKAIAGATVQIPLDLAPEVAVNFFPSFRFSIRRRKPAQPLRLLLFELKKNFPWQ